MALIGLNIIQAFQIENSSDMPKDNDIYCGIQQESEDDPEKDQIICLS
jgi:hypothetical protein